MPPPKSVTPLEALRTVVERARPVTCSVPLDEARGRYLADSIDSPPGAGFPDDPPSQRRALWDGFAVPSPVRGADELTVAGELGLKDRWPEGGIALGDCLRVECGVVLGDGVYAIVPVASVTALGGSRVRLESSPEPRQGVARPGRRGSAHSLPAGSRLTPRLEVYLLARGARQVEVFRRLRVAVLCVGGELKDVHLEPTVGGRPELTAPWLAASLERDGLEVIPLGIVADDPREIREMVPRATGRRADALVIVGGLGDGLVDRTGEALKSLGSRLFFERVTIAGLPGFVYGTSGGLEIFGLSGVPLWAAASYDLWLRPALLARLGCRQAAWDWSRWRRRLESPTGVEPERPPDGPNWRLLAGAHPEAAGFITGREPESYFSPWLAGTDAWVLVPPAGDAMGDQVYVQPLSESH
ncbi:MAG: molybdopterin-binding protein [Planctomycetota bacterium]|nr:molybdopterin-binding protein [Planctomycetota bacterium]